MGNAYDEMHDMKAMTAAKDHKTGTLSTATPVSIVLSTAGWWKLSADQDYFWIGPNAASTLLTSAIACHEWAYDTPPPVFVKANEYVAVRAVATQGTYWVDRVKGP